MTVGIGAINFGYSIAVMNSLGFDFSMQYPEYTDKKKFISNVTAASMVGAAIGSLFSGPFTRFGKKNGLHVANIILAVGCGLTLYRNIYTLIAGRVLFGLSSGTFSVFVPSFINEITPTELKGSFGSATQFLINFGILLANIIELPCTS